MALEQEDIVQIQGLITQSIQHIVPEVTNVRYELELKHQRELMLTGFGRMDQRFLEMQENMKQRFDQVEKRFEQVEKRFDQMDKRFEQVEKRFEQVDKRFEQQHQEIMGIHSDIKLLMRWMFGALVGVAGLIVAILRLA